MTSILLESFGAITTYGMLCLLLGYAWPRAWLLPEASMWVQRLVLGYSALNIIFTFSYRNDLPVRTSYIILGAFGAWALFRISRLATGKCVDEIMVLPPLRANLGYWVLALLPTVCIIYYPLVHLHTVFLGNFDPPDLSGFTADFLKDGHSWNDLQAILKEATGHTHWWETTIEQWTLPDYRAAVAMDTLIFLLRWGHAVLSTQISVLAHQPIWFGVMVASAVPFLLCPLIIMDACKSRGASTATALAITIGTAGTAGILMWDEGLFSHIAATPILTLVTLHFVGFFTRDQHIGQKFSLAVLMIALLVIWSDSVMLVACMTAMLVLMARIKPQSTPVTAGTILKGLLVIAFIGVILSPQFVAQFIWIYVDRMKHGFMGGILNLHWSLSEIVLPYPFLKIRGDLPPNLILRFPVFVFGRMVEGAGLFALGWYLLRKNRREGLELAVIALTLMTYTAINQVYIFWVVVITFQAALLVTLYFATPESVWSVRRSLVAAAYAILMLLTQFLLLYDYGRFSKHLTLEQFQPDMSLIEPNKEFAYLTPTLSNAYQRLGWSSSLTWINRRHSWAGKMVTYRTKEEADQPLYLYYDCTIEGADRCESIRRATGDRMKEKTVYPTKIKVGALLGRDNIVDKTKLDALIIKEFGIDQPQKSDQPPY